MRFHPTPRQLLAHHCPPSGPPSKGGDASCKNTSKDASPDPKTAPQPTENADLSRKREYPTESRKMRHTSPRHRICAPLAPSRFPSLDTSSEKAPPDAAYPFQQASQSTGKTALRLDLEWLQSKRRAAAPQSTQEAGTAAQSQSQFRPTPFGSARIGFVLSFCPPFEGVSQMKPRKPQIPPLAPFPQRPELPVTGQRS
jgi:hypothetical protein